MARKKGPAADTAYDIIKERILSFHMMMGDTVSDYALSQELMISRTPIREAIQRLVSEGLIRQSGSRMIVSPLTEQDIREICQVREALECKAVDIIISEGGLTSDQLAHLNDLNEKMRECIVQNDYDMNFKYDDMFHAAILEYTHNSRLIEYFDKLRLQIARARWLTVVQPGYMDSLMEHETLIMALKENDISKAKQAAELHMRNAELNFSRIFKSNDLSMAMKSLQLLKQGGTSKGEE